MTIIANPIYDVVFKYLMEDEKVARILLSALLKKEIVSLEMRRHEYSSVHLDKISLFRLDFSARVKNNDGTENLILIELQKTWLPTETLRFRQYLGTQYLDKNNMVKEPEACYGLPIVVIYILGHKLGDLTEPVIYVRRHYLDYDDHVIEQTNPFIESLTHDAVIVLLPYLKGHMRNRLERMLSIFDQEYRMEDEHYLELPVEEFPPEEQPILNRLLKAAASPHIRRDMDIEDEIISEIEARDTVIMMKNEEIEQKNKELQQKKQEIEQKKQEIEQKGLEIAQKRQEIEQKEQVIRTIVRLLFRKGVSLEEIAQQLSLPQEKIAKMI